MSIWRMQRGIVVPCQIELHVRYMPLDNIDYSIHIFNLSTIGTLLIHDVNCFLYIQVEPKNDKFLKISPDLSR